MTDVNETAPLAIVVAALAAMTPEPWRPCGAEGCKCGLVWAPPADAVVFTTPGPEASDVRFSAEQNAANVAGIVALRNHVPALVERLRRAEAVCEAVEAFVVEWDGGAEAAQDAAEAALRTALAAWRRR